MTNEKGYVTMEPTNPVQTVAPEKEETELIRATDKITALYKTELSTPKRYAPNGSIDRNWATYFISENTYA